jgi:hypothetical protein
MRKRIKALRLYGFTALRLYGFTALRLYGFTALRLYGETIGLVARVVKGVCRIAVGGWTMEPVEPLGPDYASVFRLCPPSTGMTAPLMYEAAREARKTAMPAMSAGSPIRPSGQAFSNVSR